MRASEIKTGNRIIVFMGPAKQGKTTLAATASKFAPDELPAKELTLLEDTAFLQFDSDGVSSLKKMNLDVEVEDLSCYVTLKDLIPKFNEGLKRIREQVVAGKVKFVVADTWTALDKIIVNDLSKQIQDKRVWNAILSKHMDFIAALKSLPCDVFIIVHTKYVGGFAGEETPEQIMRKKASFMPGRADMAMALSAGIGDYMRTQASNIFPVYAVPEGKGYRRIVLTQPKYGFECGTRWGGLEEEERPHMRYMMQKAGEYRG